MGLRVIAQFVKKVADRRDGLLVVVGDCLLGLFHLPLLGLQSGQIGAVMADLLKEQDG